MSASPAPRLIGASSRRVTHSTRIPAPLTCSLRSDIGCNLSDPVFRGSYHGKQAHAGPQASCHRSQYESHSPPMFTACRRPRRGSETGSERWSRDSAPDGRLPRREQRSARSCGTTRSVSDRNAFPSASGSDQSFDKLLTSQRACTPLLDVIHVALPRWTLTPEAPLRTLPRSTTSSCRTRARRQSQSESVDLTTIDCSLRQKKLNSGEYHSSTERGCGSDEI